jgi:hypothetical protein
MHHDELHHLRAMDIATHAFTSTLWQSALAI